MTSDDATTRRHKIGALAPLPEWEIPGSSPAWMYRYPNCPNSPRLKVESWKWYDDKEQQPLIVKLECGHVMSLHVDTVPDDVGCPGCLHEWLCERGQEDSVLATKRGVVPE